MTQDGQRRTRKPLPVNLAWATALVVVLAVGYVASYPLAARCTDEPDILVYRPVQYLIDNKTPLRSPIFWWADKLGDKTDSAVVAATFRRRFREEVRRRADRVGPVDPWEDVEIR